MKNRIEDLAFFGGQPAFKENLHVGCPNIGDRKRLIERINLMLDERWLTNNGPYVREFEERICELTGTNNCIAMCNATVALQIAIHALGLSGEVIVPSFTFIATAHALRWQGITPVFCDVDSRTHNLDPERVEQMITPRTTGIVGVHVWGKACDIRALVEIAQRNGLKLLFDAAHAFACSYKGEMIGRFGNAEVFSFHATKFVNTFEGGAVTTNDDDLAARIRLMRNFGFAGYDEVIDIGINGKMAEIAAAMGLTSLESLDDFISVNRGNYYLYKEGLQDIPGVTLLDFDEREKCNYQYIVVEIDEAETKIGRDELIEVLWAENVLARRYFYPGCHSMEPYRSHFPNAGWLLPNTEQLVRRVMSLPTGTVISPKDISEICQIIRLVVEDRAEQKQMRRCYAAS